MYKIRFEGDCLEKIQIPHKGTAIVDETLTPTLCDIVHCDSPVGGVSGYLKQIVDTRPPFKVCTRYKDSKCNFLMTPKQIFGVVIAVYDEHMRLVYRREKQRTEHIVELLNADANGRIVDLPCEPNDPCWLLLEKWDGKFDLIKSHVSEIKIIKRIGYFARTISVYFSCEEIGDTLEYDFAEVGTTIFFNEEDAIKAWEAKK